jgi:prepilin-type N-terminal cleavage/methylation domain-containing protein
MMKVRKNRTSRRGFSLLELLAVMSIMAMLTTLAVTSYFSAIRGMTRRSAVKHLANTLILARQRACMEGTRISVMIFNEVTGYDNAGQPNVAPSYVVCKEIGRISFKGAGTVVDEFAPLDKMFGGVTSQAELTSQGEFASVRLYNLTQGKWWNVYPKVLKVAPPDRTSALQAAKGSDKVYEIPAFGFVENTRVTNPNNASWTVGDSYGIEAAPINSLPRGFEFEKLKQDLTKVVCVTFLPDGTTKDEGPIAISTTLAPVTRNTVQVESDGAITYDEKWR